ncbi:MAG: M48 family metallopeptidase [Rhodobacteraceae bacterium]|jgi:Zn-dependent protease with chaperone function|nr:M48 family metallopeptidase [Paracoccaceae bacterium]
MASRPDFPAKGAYFDGETAKSHTVSVTGQGEYLSITPLDPPGKPFFWRLDRIRAQAGARKDTRGPLVLTLRADTDDEQPRDPARLVLQPGPVADWVRASAPALGARDLRPGTWGRVIWRTTAALGAVAAIVFVILPRLSDTLAERLPIEREVAFGQLVVANMEQYLGGADGTLACNDPAGLAALARLEQRLTTGQNLRYDLHLQVFDHPMINAFAAPGGQLVILRGLLDGAGSPAEVAGVLAHEIGHVEARDPTRLAFRAVGSAGILSLLLGDATGGALIAVMGDQVLSASYTREAEAAADAFAYRLLNDTGIGTAGLADFFESLDGKGIDLPEYLSTHPDTAGRAVSARAADGAAHDAVLSDDDWAALQGICG